MKETEEINKETTLKMEHEKKKNYFPLSIFPFIQGMKKTMNDGHPHHRDKRILYTISGDYRGLDSRIKVGLLDIRGE